MQSKKITWEDVVAAAAELEIDPCVMQAVYRVESSGSGFLPGGKPKILFEGHVFWRELQKRGLSPEQIAVTHSTVLYPKWTKEHYKGGEKEYKRLDEALAIHEEAALCSASWGAFQIMGFNHALCGYSSVRDFVSGQEKNAASQLEAFCRFIRRRNLQCYLANKEWASFAREYNGPGYAQNNYDERLQQEYVACMRAQMQVR